MADAGVATMRALAGELLLTAWEQGASQHGMRRTVTILSIALSSSGPDQLAALPIAERNLLLLRLHELTFGPSLDVFAACPECASPLEFTIPVAVMIERLESQSATTHAEWSEAGRQYRLRSVTTEDLLVAVRAADINTAQECILSRCLEVSPEAGSERLSASPQVMEKFELLHASTELNCTVDCPTCSNHEVFDLDIARFLWIEVRRAARQLLDDIHTLASAYGWSEQEITRMTANRRGAYLELLNS
jgi:hypothetical protein